MMGIAVGFHVFVCIVLITIILIQRGRGGGFVEAFSGLESMLGTKTSAFLSKLTSVFAVAFFISCLTLAFLSLRESRSLMRGAKPKAAAVANATANATTAQAPEQAAGQTQGAQPEAAAVNQTQTAQ